MAILVDYNQVMLASLFVSIGNHTNIEIDENMIRHMFLNSLRANRVKFFNDFGEIVICADGKNSWRREIFPYYKAMRKKSREESDLDWNEIFKVMTTIREELDEYFPYKVIHVDSCEADDSIGTIVHENGSILNDGSEKFLILSGDKDYKQLHKYANVSQYNPVRKEWIKTSNPIEYLEEHIIRGDKGDGIPNILSADNSIAIGERQKTITAKRLSEIVNGKMDEQTQSKYHRNKMLIDLSQVPNKYKSIINEEYSKEKTFGRTKLQKYFMDKKLKNLYSSIKDF